VAAHTPCGHTVIGMDEDHRRPARPADRKRPPTRPASRPAAVWVIAAIVMLIGLYVGYAGGTGLVVAVKTGWEERELPATLTMLTGAALIVFAVALFLGARWGRTGALTLCAILFVGTVGGFMLEILSGDQAAIMLTVVLCLFFALLGQKVHQWTGGDPS
jgi:uncharacterized membrane protein YfcA